MNQYAVWGNPIQQSKSPRIHQLFAKQTDKAINYIAKLGDETLFEQQLTGFFNSGAKGANITAPFKERAFALADIHSEACLQAQACNTLKRLDDGRLYADNTDGLGLIADLKRLTWLKPTQRVLILGAGGATKGVLYPLLQAQQSVTLYNRTPQKAVDLAEKFAKFGEIQAACWNEICQQQFDLIINATSLGLQGKCVELPVSLLVSANIYDMQYAPQQKTPFLNYARANGAENCQDGLGMLVGQAAYAFQLWEGSFPEIVPVLQQLSAEMNS
ncbi:Shikimate dehydrogenase [Bibersteinia trehalosi USDA-ARS-USMARC-188]|uniref:Shikimate dehydrogenase (NADP(+)) n=2 Tax=Bibersteinia trehalosi TaxID=47735 RepID=A0A4V7I884_BIBTR|nr:shikimate dehydrogenase [Bibersteinia trehalosi]AGH39060.1 Shikimate dehydrogenase [Bibersteinia trehalosi USDA-ARS-USMARC-192]AHG81192.1 Shikimate dehydrogenase [Bibersteinia trehalosi USDA-ARS-USMARC-188]AHG83406.1 Shikimate dehydrogenase [Bibersteinia trehalosi USDA-ARS-USMARC-189]